MPDSVQTEIVRPLPANLQKEYAELFIRSSRYSVSDPGILHLRNGLVFWQGQIFIHFQIFPESLSTPLFVKKYSLKFLLLCMAKAALRRNLYFFLKNRYLVVHDEWSANYFHWLTDTVTRLYLVKDFLQEVTLILPESFCLSFHQYTIEKFGVKKVQFINDRKIFCVKKIILPAHTRPAENPVLLRAAVAFLTREIKVSTRTYGDRIYISRRNASVRQIINEHEVINCLRNYGFEILNIEEYSFEDQVNILYHAKYLVSIHGAGLTNLMFMPTGSSILELRKKGGSEIYNCYYTLATVFNHRYFYQACESDSDESPQKANIYVDVEKLRQTLALMGLPSPVDLN
jgi:capsular polysaccharide biosynthesis protein